MSQNDFTIANQTFPNTRADINSALQALASTSSGSSAPSTTFANQFFYNTTSNLLQIRNEGNDAYITIAELDQTNDTVEYFKSDSVRTALIEFTDGDDALAIADGGALTTAGNLSIGGSNNELRFYEGSNYVGFEAPALSADKIWVLPTADGTSGQALVTNGSGTLSFADTAALRPSVSPIIINGDMTISQRLETKTGMGGGDGVYPTIDRYRHSITNAGGAGRFTSTQQAVTDIAGFTESLNIDCTTADTSIAAGEEFHIDQKIEGRSVQAFQKGFSTALGFTVAFYLKAQDAKVYAVELKDTDNNRHCTKLFTSTTGWTRHVLNYPADTSGKFVGDSNTSLEVKLWLHAGSNFTSGTLPSSWQGVTTANTCPGIGSVYDNTDNSVSITGLQLEVGTFTASTIPDFQYESFGDSLIRCQRYFEKSLNYSVLPGSSCSTSSGNWQSVLLNANDFYNFGYAQWTTRKRVAPTITTFSYATGASGKGRMQDSVDITMNSLETSETQTRFNTGGTGSTNNYVRCYYTQDSEL